MARSNNYLDVGVLLRPALRRELAKAGIEFTETKTLLNSIFIIPDDNEYLAVCRALREQGFDT